MGICIYSLRVFVLLAIACRNNNGVSAFYSNIEVDLAQALLSNYSATGRPVASNKQPVTVEFDLKLHKIEKLITKEQHLIVHTFVTMKWFEPRLTWDPADHNGTTLINLEQTQLWKPDIILYNNADISNNGPTEIYKGPAHVYNNGTIVWFSTVAWQSSCAVDITWFPVDQQTCDLVFGSLSYSKSRLKLVSQQLQKSYSDFASNHHVTNGEWIVKKMTAKLNEHHYDCCHEAVSQVVFSLTLKRRPLYFFLYLIFPVIAIVLLSLMVFKIPAQAGERVGFAITCLLTMGVYLIVISQDLPKTADNAPMVGILYVTLFYVMVLGVLTGIINARLAYKMTPAPPEKLYKFVLKMREKKFKKVRAKIASMRGHSKKEELKNAAELTEVKKIREESRCGRHHDNEAIDSSDAIIEESQTSLRREDFLRKRTSFFSLQDQANNHQPVTQEDIDNQGKWQEIADFSDRVFFWLYLALIVISSSSVLLGLHIHKEQI
eukprot:gene16940-18646_t